MTMAEEMDPMGNTSHANDFQANNNINNNNSLTTNNNMPWKQRKRKRLSAVLDKLHNNNNSSHHQHHNDSNNNNNNNSNNSSNNSSNSSNNSLGESSAEMKNSPPHSSNEYHHKMGTESIKSSVDEDDDDEERTTVASDDLHSNGGSPIVKRERFSSPLHFAVNDENGLSAEQIKLEDRMSDYDGNRSELNVSPMERYFPQMPSPLFEYYLQTKYLPEILRMRGNRPSFGTNASNVSVPDVPLNESGTIADTSAAESHPKQVAPPRKRQRQSKQQQSSSYAAIPENLPPQDAPLDLSMKTICESIKKATALAKKAAAASAVLQQQHQNAVNQWRSHDLAAQMPSIYPNILSNAGQLGKYAHHSPLATANGLGQVPIIKGDVASPTTKESVAFRYNLDVSPVVEEMPPGNDVAYVCPICGQMFSLHDRLAKHMASRHKSKSNSTEITKSYVCEVCDRSFARSDMLTRHMRLHTGIKPYTCKVCSQVFSRSDHLSTHQRTHTGEKPYKCPQCPYAACRRDMITRHMRTHARYEAQRAAAAAVATNASDVGAHMGKGRATLSPTMANELSKVTIKIETNHSSTSPTTSPYAATDEQLHSYHHHNHRQLNNNSSRNNNNFLLNHHHLLNHPADDLVSAATSVANTIIKTENTLLKIQ